jgi:hypothetical protein
VKATKKQAAYLEGIRAHLRSELVTAVLFRSCGCITAEIGAIVRVIRCPRCESAQERTQRLNRKIPRACYCGQVDNWTAQTSLAFRQHDPEKVDQLRRLRMAHVCEPRDVDDAHRGEEHWEEVEKGTLPYEGILA